MIILNDVYVSFNLNTPLERFALRGLTLRIHAGEFVTVIGGNGAGKSTLLHLLAGDIKATQGSLLIDQKNITSLSEPQRSKFVSRVFQDPLIGSCGELSIEENMSLAYLRGKSRGLKRALTHNERNYFKELVTSLDLGLENHLKIPMKHLSGGQRQAISLLMATLQPSKILLLDEHTASLDPRMAKKVMSITMKLVKEQNLTVLMVTHSMTQALEYGTRILLLQDGHIQKDITGQERESLTPYDLLKYFEI
ncbi:MAG: ABC transporter ATP-binding protein [Verrucomicrobia bacterium]|nr:MAG: ABC transporter ATP-binding protein [Verrucomicrobiota bacterium]